MIKVFDRRKGEPFEERVYGGDLVDSAYHGGWLSPVITRPILQKWLSRLTGFGQDLTFSARYIDAFITKFGVDMGEFITPDAGFRSFNDFFVRHFKPGQREFPSDARRLGSPAEGRLSVFPITGESLALNIKGAPISISKLVGSPILAQPFIGGHAFVFRLCPVDYHRFHFPDDGRAGPSTRLGNELHSVNPVALAEVPDVFLRNERQVCQFESKNFGTVALIEIGALCVGRIVQTYQAGQKITRGQEKGYFAFGGSTTVMLTQKFWVHPDADLLNKTQAGLECLVRLGEPIGKAGLVPA